MTKIRLRGQKLQWLETDGEIVALDESASLYVSTNGSGTLLWRKLVTGTTRCQLVELLVETFAIESETAARDVDRFLADLAERGLLQS